MELGSLHSLLEAAGITCRLPAPEQKHGWPSPRTRAETRVTSTPHLSWNTGDRLPTPELKHGWPSPRTRAETRVTVSPYPCGNTREPSPAPVLNKHWHKMIRMCIDMSNNIFTKLTLDWTGSSSNSNYAMCLKRTCACAHTACDTVMKIN